MELKDSIMKYNDSNNKTEKSELKSELLKNKTELDLPEAFQIAVLGHYEDYRISGAKPYLGVMLKYAS